MSWRIVGTIDTTFLSWVFTGTAGTALQIGGIELFTKIFLFYIHERVWLAIPWARSSGDKDGTVALQEGYHRSIAKAVSWRITGTIDTIVIAFFITGRMGQALSIGMTEVVTKVFLYYVHERVWQNLHFGLDAATHPDPAEKRS